MLTLEGRGDIVQKRWGMDVKEEEATQEGEFLLECKLESAVSTFSIAVPCGEVALSPPFKPKSQTKVRVGRLDRSTFLRSGHYAGLDRNSNRR